MRAPLLPIAKPLLWRSAALVALALPIALGSARPTPAAPPDEVPAERQGDSLPETLRERAIGELAQENLGSIAAESVGLGDLRPGAPASVLDALGEPSDRREFEAPDGGGTYQAARYPGLDAAVRDGVLFRFTARSADWANPDGVRVGDPAAQVVERYGLPPGTPSLDAVNHLTYYVLQENLGAYITFKLDDENLVESIDIGLLPD